MWSSVVLYLLDGKVAVTIADGISPVGFSIVSESAIVCDGWTHVAYSIDLQNKVGRIFINGFISTEKTLEQKSTSALVVETDHPYDNNMRKYWTVKEPNAVKYKVTPQAQDISQLNFFSVL